MARFFINLRLGHEVYLDDEGTEAPNVEAAKALAIASAREVIAEAIKFNRSIPDGVLVLDESGDTVVTLSLAQLVPPALRGL
jgi:hypothetical protein